MKQKMLSWLLVLAVAMMPLFGVTEKAQADDVNDPIQEKMNALQLDLEKYETSGDIQKPLVKQLQNKLKQAQHQFDRDSRKQAINDTIWNRTSKR